MPAGEPHTMLSPVEKAVLTYCDTWRTIEEIQLALWSEFHFDRIPPAVAFLRRRRLLENFNEDERSRLDPEAVVFHQSSLGALVLQAQLRREAEADFTPERRLHLV